MSDYSDHQSATLLLQEAIRILDAWHVSRNDQPAYLGLPSTLKPREYNRIRLGTMSPGNGDVYERAYAINRIHQATLTLFPFSEDSANLWVQIPLRRFGGQSALDIMKRHGLPGMREVDLVLDNQYPAAIA